MATQREILVLDEATPQIMAPQTGVDSYLAPVTLDAATGDEVAFDIPYVVNKASSGAATGLRIASTDTAVPGAHKALEVTGGGQVLLPQNNVPAAPTLAFGDGDSGFYEISDDSIGVAMQGSADFAFRKTAFEIANTNYLHFNSGGIGGTTATRVGGLAGVNTPLKFEILESHSGDVFNFGVVAGRRLVASSGTQGFFNVTPDINQSGTAGYTGILLDVTETATGSGATNLMDLQVAGTSKIAIDNTGTIVPDKTTADEGFINFKATADADATSAISTLTTSGGTTHHIQVEINGTTAWIAASTTDPS